MRGYALMPLLFTIILIISACSKIDDHTELNITISPIPTSYSIPIITSLDTGRTIATIALKFYLDSMIHVQNERFSAKDIKSIRLNTFKIELTDKDTAFTFANFENLRLTLQGNGESSNLLASLNPADSKVKVLNIPVTATVNDLKKLTGGGTISYVLKGKLRRATTKAYPISASSTFRVLLEL
jgi:hypothetical protein